MLGGYLVGVALFKVFIVSDPSKYPEPARRNYELTIKLGISTMMVREVGDSEYLEGSLKECAIVIVGLIGISLRGEVVGLYRDVIEMINNSGKVVVNQYILRY